MKLEIVSKGKYYWNSGQSATELVTPNAVHLVIGGKSKPTDDDAEKLVSFRNINGCWTPSCTCRFGSNTGEAHGTWCSHIITGIIHARHHKLNPMFEASRKYLVLRRDFSLIYIRFAVANNIVFWQNPDAKGWRPSCDCGQKGLCEHIIATVYWLHTGKNNNLKLPKTALA